jgi:hypothetical protein
MFSKGFAIKMAKKIVPLQEEGWYSTGLEYIPYILLADFEKRTERYKNKSVAVLYRFHHLPKFTRLFKKSELVPKMYIEKISFIEAIAGKYYSFTELDKLQITQVIEKISYKGYPIDLLIRKNKGNPLREIYIFLENKCIEKA